ncbi:MAG: LysM peptidoglycan-binding domain-containing protein [Ilumatobacter sp.]|uniref:LysM peptidoglycan-binding domain-containing protein n=1 Tax=Ilumatobacter sp. TaxID=1967498 RepID=UPI0026206335|nr:LysM peptidoglycan-binding domain-containing protein [Ilumatobacter sp.]MDJ0771779.1 LysM peptidoglycan-binding domain-containing protein [Ilumatobacter sp.]
MLVGAELRRSVASFVTSSVATAAAVAVAVVVTPTPAVAGFACSSDAPTYTVKSGDGWFAIADRVEVSARSLVEANGASLADLLVPGDRLCLPRDADVTGACGSTYTVSGGDGWYRIADRAGTSVSSLLAANGATLDRAIHPGETVCLPDGAAATSGETSGSSAAGGGTYTVSRGDSWFGIAARADVSARSLLAANDASSSDLIVPGQVIRLPAGATQPASSGASTRGWVDLDALPVQGPCWYADTWHAPRSGGRLHKGVDLITPSGAYVYAVVDGRLTSRIWDQPGRLSGNAWTLTGDDGTSFFYAHLIDFAPEVRVGSRVEAGQIIGWVGSTGNSSAPHLHFEIRPGGGEAVNPYPTVHAAGGCNRGTPYRQPGGWIPS